MAQFKYTARNTAGKMIEGVIEAPIQKGAIDRLRNQKYTVMTLVEVKAGEASFWGASTLLKARSRERISLFSAGSSPRWYRPVFLSSKGLNILSDQIEEARRSKKVISVRCGPISKVESLLPIR